MFVSAVTARPPSSLSPTERLKRQPLPEDQVVLLWDDMEGEGHDWLLRGPWAKVDSPCHGKVYADSPLGQYDPNANVRLVSQPLHLDVDAPFMSFALKVDTEAGADPVTVEIAENHPHKRHTWVELARYSGQMDWQIGNVSLAGWEDKEVQVRFRLQSDSQNQADGILVDDVLIAGKPRR